jgi:hypothetical protein
MLGGRVPPCRHVRCGAHDVLRRFATASAAVLSLCVAARADASDAHTSSLSWVQLPGAEECGGAPAIARAVEQRLGRPAFVSPAQAEFSIEGRAERDGTRFRAVLVLRDSAGVQIGARELESDAADCNELRDNVALAVALMIDPDAALHAPPQGNPAPPPSAPPAVLVERVEMPAALTPTDPWQVEPTAAAAIGYGFLPSASVGAVLGTTVRPQRFWSVELYGGVWAAQTVAAQSGASTRLSSAFGGLALCPLRVRGGDLSFELCAGGRVGLVGSTPSGFTTAQQGGSLPTVHLVVDPHLSLVVAHGVLLRAGGSLAAALLRSEFVFDNSAGAQGLFDAPVLAATADLGLAVSLP